MGSKNHNFRFSKGLAVGLALGATMTMAFYSVGDYFTSKETPARRYSDLAVVLEDGSFSQGNELPSFPKPGNPTRYEESDGSSWWLCTYPVEADTVLLYGRAADRNSPVLIYGAQRVPHRRTTGDERWYFCDPDLMAQYVTIATLEPESP